MSVNLTRYVFKRIRGRIVPIRKGVEKITRMYRDGISKSASKKLKYLEKLAMQKNGPLRKYKRSGEFKFKQRIFAKSGTTRLEKITSEKMTKIIKKGKGWLS